MSNFTPGKWEVDEFGHICADKVVIAKALGKPEAVVGNDRRLRVGESVLSPVYMENVLGYSREEWLKELDANARLMAAAPELYRLLKEELIPTSDYGGILSFSREAKVRELLDRIDGKEVSHD